MVYLEKSMYVLLALSFVSFIIWKVYGRNRKGKARWFWRLLVVSSVSFLVGVFSFYMSEVEELVDMKLIYKIVGIVAMIIFYLAGLGSTSPEDTGSSSYDDSGSSRKTIRTTHYDADGNKTGYSITEKDD